jgi:hypothetical protein
VAQPRLATILQRPWLVSALFHTATLSSPCTKQSKAPIAHGRSNPTEHVDGSAIHLEKDADNDDPADIAEAPVHAAPRLIPRPPWHYRLMNKLGHWLIRRATVVNEDFTRYVRIAYKPEGEDEICDWATAEIDTKCSGDWISAHRLKELSGVDYSQNTPTLIAHTLHRGPIYSFGEVKLRWSARNNKPGWSPGMPSFKPKYYSAVFQVIDTDDFEVIIGQPSINEHKLVKLDNRIFGAYKAYRPALPTRRLRLCCHHRTLLTL